MRPKVYLETSIASYLTARPSRNILLAANQQVTKRWWATRHRFELFISDAVLEEASLGDPSAAARRLAAIEGITMLTIDDRATDLAELLLRRGALPPKAEADALHVAIAALSNIDYLLTWNCTHIANAALRGRIVRTLNDRGLEAPIICTPYELEAQL